MTTSNDPALEESHVYLPDFCATSTLFIVVLVAELVAFVLTFAAHDTAGQFLIDLSKTSFFILWVALLGTALMCQLKPKLEQTGSTRAFTISYIALDVMCLVLAEGAWQVNRIFGRSAIIDDTHTMFVLRTFAISSIVIALAMRYLYISSEWRRSIILEAQARISALQALIRPHFLFNSMNTIASLTRTDPKLAEEAVEDLSDLFRANLASPGNRSSVKQELEIASIYQRIEKLRLGDRLVVRWDINELPMHAAMPSLTIQPLLENAIYHGIELLPEGGEVTVTGKQVGEHLEVTMSNPVAPSGERRGEGNKMALANIRQRFELAYDNDATVVVDDSEDRFAITLRFPAQDNRR